MEIQISYQEEQVVCAFAPYYPGKRMYMRTTDLWYPVVGWCPHLNLGGGECRDCSLVLEDSDE